MAYIKLVDGEVVEGRHVHVPPPPLPEPGPWYQMLHDRPHTHGWYECRLSYISMASEMLYWNGKRWLRGMCQGRYVPYVKMWRGLREYVDPVPWGRYVIHHDDSPKGNVRRLLWDFKLMYTKFNIVTKREAAGRYWPTDIHLSPQLFAARPGPRRRPRLACEPQFEKFEPRTFNEPKPVDSIIENNGFTAGADTP